jgi:hypothetical protein
MELPPIKTVPAKYFRKCSARVIDWIVIHTIESPEMPTGAENCARYFTTIDRPASAHYCIDNDSIVRCVPDMDIAYGAPNANNNGLHFEHAGRAAQSAEEWRDAFSQAMLRLSARLAAHKAREFQIPLVWLLPADLLAKRRGITTHASITISFKRRGGHTDPGEHFPAEQYLDMVKEEYNMLGAPAIEPAAPPAQPHSVVALPRLHYSHELSPDIAALQFFLNGLREEQLIADGIAGPATSRAFKELTGYYLKGDPRSDP